MNRKEIKEFLDALHFHGYIDHDITKLENLIDDYYPKQLQQSDVIKSVCTHQFKYEAEDVMYRCVNCDAEVKYQTVL